MLYFANDFPSFSENIKKKVEYSKKKINFRPPFGKLNQNSILYLWNR